MTVKHAVDVLNVYDAADRRIAFLAVCGCGWQRQTFNHQTARTLGKAHEVEANRRVK